MLRIYWINEIISIMFSLCCYSYSKGSKSSGLKPKEYVTNQKSIVAARVLFYPCFFFTFWFYSFEPDTEFSRIPRRKNIWRHWSARPREVQKERDHERHKKERVWKKKKFPIFSESVVHCFFAGNYCGQQCDATGAGNRTVPIQRSGNCLFRLFCFAAYYKCLRRFCS